jgi:hypothetical protein
MHGFCNWDYRAGRMADMQNRPGCAGNAAAEAKESPGGELALKSWFAIRTVAKAGGGLLFE